MNDADDNIKRVHEMRIEAKINRGFPMMEVYNQEGSPSMFPQ